MVNNNTHGSITEDTKKGYGDLNNYELSDNELKTVSGAGEANITPDIIDNETMLIIPVSGTKKADNNDSLINNHFIGRTVY